MCYVTRLISRFTSTEQRFLHLLYSVASVMTAICSAYLLPGQPRAPSPNGMNAFGATGAGRESADFSCPGETADNDASSAGL